jgi:hypothetical protein
MARLGALCSSREFLNRGSSVVPARGVMTRAYPGKGFTSCQILNDDARIPDQFDDQGEQNEERHGEVDDVIHARNVNRE